MVHWVHENFHENFDFFCPRVCNFLEFFFLLLPSSNFFYLEQHSAQCCWSWENQTATRRHLGPTRRRFSSYITQISDSHSLNVTPKRCHQITALRWGLQYSTWWLAGYTLPSTPATPLYTHTTHTMHEMHLFKQRAQAECTMSVVYS